jgi:hypothetical protein
MADYIHKPILVYGSRENVDRAGLLLREIILSLAPNRDFMLHDNLALPQISAMANDFAFWMIPGSGGKPGGRIDIRWSQYIAEWKYRVEQADFYVNWVELELDETKPDAIKQTNLEFREELHEEMDP